MDILKARLDMLFQPESSNILLVITCVSWVSRRPDPYNKHGRTAFHRQ